MDVTDCVCDSAEYSIIHGGFEAWSLHEILEKMCLHYSMDHTHRANPDDCIVKMC